MPSAVDYWRVRIAVEPSEIEAVAAWLMEFGVGGVEFEDGEPPRMSRFTDIALATPAAPFVAGYFADDERWPDTASRIRQRAAAAGWAVVVERIPTQSWETAWKQYYGPVALPDGYGIVPTWHAGSPFAAEKTIWLDPGMAFGTGTHATTRSCLEILIAQGAAKPRVLDLGAGSGILSLAAAKLSAMTVDAVEPDPVAVRALTDNIRANGLERRIHVICGTFADLPVGPPYDLVLMNLTRELIREWWPSVQQRLTGWAVLSGLLEDAVPEMETMVRRHGGFQVVEYRIRQGWATLRIAR